jgi:hypothetical protein
MRWPFRWKRHEMTRKRQLAMALGASLLQGADLLGVLLALLLLGEGLSLSLGSL